MNIDASLFASSMRYRFILKNKFQLCFVLMISLFMLGGTLHAFEKTSAVHVERTMDEDGSPKAFKLTLYGSDKDNSQVQWSVDQQPQHGVASIEALNAAISVHYQPELNWNGQDHFVVKVADKDGGYNTINVTVHVSPRNDPPVNVKQPTITGLMNVGETIIADKGRWDDSTDGESSDFHYVYQWMRATNAHSQQLTPIPNATARHYLITESDRHAYLAVRVIAKDKKEKKEDQLTAFATSDVSRVGNQAPMISLTAPEETFILKAFAFEGNQKHTASELNRVLKDFIGQEVGLSDLKEASNKIMTFYQNTSKIIVNAQVPAQEISPNDAVRMVIIEGHLGTIRVAGNKTYSKDFLVNQVSGAIDTSQPLHLNDLESALLSLNKNAGLEVRSVLQRGSKRGDVDILLKVQDKKSASVSLGYNNDGSGSISKDRYILGLGLFNVRDVGGHLNMQILSGNNPRELAYATMVYVEPVGNRGTKVGFTASTGSYEVAKKFFDLGVKGDNNTFSAYVNHPFKVSRDFTLNAEVGMEAKDANFFILGAKTSRDRIRTLYVSTNAELNAFGGHSFLSARLTQGLGELFGGILNSANASRQGADNLFTRIEISASHNQPLSKHWSVYGAASGQISDDSLVSSEEWQIGGVNSVRGHLAGAQTGDIGYRTSLEFRYSDYGELPWIAYTFLDYGYALRRVPFIAQSKDNWLAGAGAGLIVQKDFKYITFNLNVNLGLPVHLSTTAQKDRNPVFNISTSFKY
ncbi:MAG: ShlB/FhaC/HecB family hemolysin secretion/activation protein [Mariprofundaceae bacterium]|nr:ShlB/FhaC/HecB family hemolysin secretion/activation protein [Mariprofundaceae bacterium]